MATEANGSSSAGTPENGSESSTLILPTGETVESVPLVVGSFSIDDAIAMHLVDCAQCRSFTEHARPVPNIPRIGGQRDGHCTDYWQLQLMRANYEGARNNIVAHTEMGGEAQTGRPLE
jgi:hypothetical protein